MRTNYLVAYNSGNLRLSITCNSALQKTSWREDPDAVEEILLIVWQPSMSVVRPSSAPSDLRYALKGNPGTCVSTAAWGTHTRVVISVVLVSIMQFFPRVNSVFHLKLHLSLSSNSYVHWISTFCTCNANSISYLNAYLKSNFLHIPPDSEIWW